MRSSNSMGETIDLSQEHDEEAHARGCSCDFASALSECARMGSLVGCL